MENFSNKNEMAAEMKKRKLDIQGPYLYAQNPTEYAGEWKYKFPPAPGKEGITPVSVDLIPKYQKELA